MLASCYHKSLHMNLPTSLRLAVSLMDPCVLITEFLVDDKNCGNGKYVFVLHGMRIYCQALDLN